MIRTIPNLALYHLTMQPFRIDQPSRLRKPTTISCFFATSVKRLKQSIWWFVACIRHAHAFGTRTRNEKKNANATRNTQHATRTELRQLLLLYCALHTTCACACACRSDLQWRLWLVVAVAVAVHSSTLARVDAGQASSCDQLYDLRESACVCGTATAAAAAPIQERDMRERQNKPERRIINTMIERRVRAGYTKKQYVVLFDSKSNRFLYIYSYYYKIHLYFKM